MPRSYAEAFFRHPVMLVLPVIVAMVLGTAFGLSRPREYLAASTVWADSRLPVESTIGRTGAAEPPSAGQQALLSGLLASRSFLLELVRASPLAAAVNGAPDEQVDRVLAEVGASVMVSTPGPQVVSISVRQPTPALATGLAKAVTDTFLKEQSARLRARGEAQVAYDEAQVDSTSERLDQVRGAEGADAPGEGQAAANSPLGEAEQQYQDALSALAQSSAALSLAQVGALDVLDEATHAYPQSRRKTVLVSGVGGLLAGGSLAALALVVLVLRDRSVRTADDLERLVGLRPGGTIPLVAEQARRASGSVLRRRRGTVVNGA